MTFDAQKHMEGLPLTEEKVGREIETRNYEQKVLMGLALIYEDSGLASKKSMMESGLKNLAKEVAHLNASRWDPVNSSGGNAEILARLVGADIMMDFPEVVEVGGDNPEYEIDWNMKNGQMVIRTGYTCFERGSGVWTKTKAEFRFTADQISERMKVLEQETRSLNKLMD